LISIVLLGVVQALAQGDPPEDDATYVLTKAIKEPLHPIDNPQENKIAVAFGKSFPSCKNNPGGASSPAVENPDNWVITSEALGNSQRFQPGTKTTLIPVSATVDGFCEGKLALLTFSQRIEDTNDGLFDPLTHKVTITYKQGNFPDVRFARPDDEAGRQQKIFTAANDKDNSDIYLFGSATGAHKSKPIYSLDVKLGYFWELKRHGRLGPKFTFTSDEGSDVDPDSITLKLAYENIFVLGPSKYLFVNIDPVGGEFNKDGDTRNLISSFRLKYVPRSVFLNETNIAAVDFTFGLEGGHNFENAVDEDGAGGILRWNLGVSAHYVALAPWKFKRVFINADYLVRLPQRAEIFIEKIDDNDVFTITKKPRHLVNIGADFMFSDAVGITTKYEFGSLPPSFRLVDHKVSAGFTLKLRQNR